MSLNIQYQHNDLKIKEVYPMPVLTPEEYRKRAEQMADPSYNTKVAQVNADYNDNLSQLNNQQGVVNTNYDRQVQQNAQNTKMSQNAYSNNVLSRGMARSSIATTGLAGIQNQGNQNEANINMDRNNQLNNLENLKTTLKTKLTSALSSLSADRETNVNSIAEQLRQRDEDIQAREQAAAEDKRRWEAEMAFKQQQEARVAANKTSSSSNSSKGLTTKQITEFKKQIEAEYMSISHNPTEREKWLEANQQDILAAVGGDTTYLDYLKKKAGEGASYYYGTGGYSLH
jgi:hypothetical protein